MAETNCVGSNIEQLDIVRRIGRATYGALCHSSCSFNMVAKGAWNGNTVIYDIFLGYEQNLSVHSRHKFSYFLPTSFSS